MAHYDAFKLHGWLFGRYILLLQSADAFVSLNCEPSTPITDIITEPVNHPQRVLTVAHGTPDDTVLEKSTSTLN